MYRSLRQLKKTDGYITHVAPVQQEESSVFIRTIILDILYFIPSSFISARIPKTYYLPVLIHYFLNVLSIHAPTPFFVHQLSTILPSSSQPSQALHTITRTQREYRGKSRDRKQRIESKIEGLIVQKKRNKKLTHFLRSDVLQN